MLHAPILACFLGDEMRANFYRVNPMCDSSLVSVFGTLTPALAPGASENADYADLREKSLRFSAFICVLQRPKWELHIK
jgi:hypothetical protein